MKSTPKVYDIVISGAGPVGLFLACELALAKCSVLILEEAPTPSSPLKRMPFGIRGLSTPTIEALDRRGLLEELEIHKKLKNPHQNAAQGPRRQGGHFAGIPFLEGNVDHSQWKYRLPSSPPTNLISEMEELETVLTRRAEALGVEIKRGSAVTAFHERENGVQVQADDQLFEGQWLVGCDGARSIIRKNSGFEFAGTDPEFTGYSTSVDIADPTMLSPGRNVTTRGMYMQSQPGYVLIQDFDGGAFHHSKKPITREHVQAVLRRISDTNVTINALHVATTWTDRARQATTYRKGHILLAGDAAHIHSPLGGQGLNLGLGDAMNLGWKLAAIVHSKAPESLVDSYQTERQPIGEKVLEWSRAQVAIMKTDPAARALHAIIRDLMNTRDGATYFAGRVAGVSTHYDFSGGHPLVGYSVPNFEFGEGTKLNELMRDGRGVILDFETDAKLKNLADEFHDRMTYISGKAKDQLGLTAAIIRPDGYIYWATDTEPDALAIRNVIAQLFSSLQSRG